MKLIIFFLSLLFLTKTFASPTNNIKEVDLNDYNIEKNNPVVNLDINQTTFSPMVPTVGKITWSDRTINSQLDIICPKKYLQSLVNYKLEIKNFWIKAKLTQQDKLSVELNDGIFLQTASGLIPLNTNTNYDNLINEMNFVNNPLKLVSNKEISLNDPPKEINLIGGFELHIKSGIFGEKQQVIKVGLRWDIKTTPEIEPDTQNNQNFSFDMDNNNSHTYVSIIYDNNNNAATGTRRILKRPQTISTPIDQKEEVEYFVKDERITTFPSGSEKNRFVVLRGTKANKIALILRYIFYKNIPDPNDPGSTAPPITIRSHIDTELFDLLPSEIADLIRNSTIQGAKLNNNFDTIKFSNGIVLLIGPSHLMPASFENTKFKSYEVKYRKTLETPEAKTNFELVVLKFSDPLLANYVRIEYDNLGELFAGFTKSNELYSNINNVSLAPVKIMNAGNTVDFYVNNHRGLLMLLNNGDIKVIGDNGKVNDKFLGLSEPKIYSTPTKVEITLNNNYVDVFKPIGFVDRSNNLDDDVILIKGENDRLVAIGYKDEQNGTKSSGPVEVTPLDGKLVDESVDFFGNIIELVKTQDQHNPQCTDLEVETFAGNFSKLSRISLTKPIQPYQWTSPLIAVLLYSVLYSCK